MSMKRTNYLGPVVVVVNPKESHWDIGEAIHEKLWCPLTENSLQYWVPNVSYDSGIYDGFRTLESEDGVTLFGPEEVYADLQKFESHFRKQLRYLESVSESVTVRYGMVSFVW